MLDQLGHASIKITVDTYYHWLPSQQIVEVSELDEIGKARNNPQPRRKRGYGIHRNPFIYWCRGTELNRRHGDFQS